MQYIARLFQGTLSIIDLPPRKQFERSSPATRRKLTAAARSSAMLAHGARLQQPINRQTADFTGSAQGRRRAKGNPIPRSPGEASPIKYCIYVIKENRTYDQVLGDLPQGNGDPKLCLFPERVTPNLHRLAREFVLLDNFYVDAEVSADGHEWSMGAYATDFVEKMWPLNYGHNRTREVPLPGGRAISRSPPRRAGTCGTGRGRRG